MKKLIPLILILSLIAAACGDEDAEGSDTTRDDSQAFVESVEFLFLESYPVQVRATVAGNLPTPCHQLAWNLDDSDPEAPVLDVWSTSDPDEVCAQVLEPFTETIDLGSFETGNYVLVVNGESHPFSI